MKSRLTVRAGRKSAQPGSVGENGTPTLPAWKAFVVQFSRESGAGSEVFCGRVEHLNSGRRARFTSRQDLLAVLSRMLEDIEESAR